MKERHFLAFDLGATSGRTVLGTLREDGVLETKELTRFPNRMLELRGRLYWNIHSLYSHILEGLSACVREGVSPESMAIDTWGVDVAMINPDGEISALPFAYRDSGTTGCSKLFFEEVMPAEEVYKLTGSQHLDINTLFRLYANRDNFAQKTAETILFTPDALIYLLTGEKVTEYTIASTGEIINPETHEIIPELVEKTGLSRGVFASVVEPGTCVGVLSEEVAEATGIGRIKVIAVGGHDTASAVAAIPAVDADFAFLSSGTWSLMGIESTGPIINVLGSKENVTNEGGVFNTVRVLKNITGMWIVEECLRKWRSEGVSYSYPEMVELAIAAPAFKAFINPDDPLFTAPRSMPEAIDSFCRKTGQPVPETHGEYLRLVFESLAMTYRKTLEVFHALSPHPVKRLQVIGGGSRNTLLNRFTANAIGLPVVAGPAEASAIGNIMMQTGCKSLQELRDVVSRSVETDTYEPESTEEWNEGYLKFLECTCCPLDLSMQDKLINALPHA